MAVRSRRYIPSMDRPSVVHQKSATVWHLRGDVYSGSQNIRPILSCLLPVHCRFCPCLLRTPSKPGVY